MIIPINVASSSSSNPKLPPGLAKISHDEIVLIELQGALEVECNHVSERDGKLVGKLKVDTASSKPTLLIGHHLLEGKIANLSKPLAVLLRSNPAGAVITSSSSPELRHYTEVDVDVESQTMGTGMETQMEMESAREREIESGKNGTTVEWDMVAIVKRKIVFARRPMPIVNLGAQHKP